MRDRDIPAEIPGCVHTDLIRAGLLGDPNLDFNERDQFWVGRTDWSYACRFDLDPTLLDTDRIDLVCDGLDTIATLELNGHVIGAAANMHHAHRFDVRGSLRADDNELIITVRGPMTAARELEAERGGLPCNGKWGPYNQLRKMACNFGWDWGPMVATCGIWRDLRLHAWSGARLRSVRPIVSIRDEQGGDAQAAIVRVPVVLELDQSRGSRHSVEATLNTSDDRTYRGAIDLDADQGVAELTLHIPDPPLWHPRGHGDQPLHTLHVGLHRDGEVIDEWSRRIGFRTVELDTSPDESGGRFVLRVNAKPIFCKGANWIPDGLFPSRMTRERYRERLQQAVDANMNMLRVWGGGIYEDDAFYEICDELGVLVWQDFMFACAAYSEDESMRVLVETEAREVVTRLCPHPSIVLWCGGNENIIACQQWDGFKEAVGERAWGLGYYLDLLPRVVGELDPSRPYWPDSPYSGSMKIPPGDDDHGDQHTWDRKLEAYRGILPRFVSEFGHQSPPTMATLREAVDESQLQIDSEAMVHRQRAWGRNVEQYDRFIEERFGQPASFSEWHYFAQVVQTRAVSLNIQWLRAQMPRCMGALFWQLNDCWAGHSWSCIDVGGCCKPLWYAVRRAFSPRLLTIQPAGAAYTPGDDLFLYLINDTDEAWRPGAGPVRAALVDFEGGVVGETTITEADVVIQPRAVVRHELDGGSIVNPPRPRRTCIACEAGGERAVWFFERDRELEYPEARYTTALDRTPTGCTLTITAETLLRDLCVFVDRLDPQATISEQCVTLLPGDRCEFEITTRRALSIDQLLASSVLRCANRSVSAGDRPG